MPTVRALHKGSDSGTGDKHQLDGVINAAMNALATVKCGVGVGVGVGLCCTVGHSRLVCHLLGSAHLLISMKMLCGHMQIWQTEQGENDALNRHGIELNFHPAGNIFRFPPPPTPS